MTVTTNYEGVEFDRYNGMWEKWAQAGELREVPEESPGMQDLDINPLEGSLHAFPFEK